MSHLVGPASAGRRKPPEGGPTNALGGTARSA
jgi:hypothetical protein